MNKITIYACPNNCGVPLVAECEVIQDWCVNIEGDPIEPQSEPLPELNDDPKCPHCGAEAEEYEDCEPIPVYDCDGREVFTAYVPDKKYRIAFLTNEDVMSVRRVDIVRRHGADCFIDNGAMYLLGENGFTRYAELDGQQSLFAMT